MCLVGMSGKLSVVGYGSGGGFGGAGVDVKSSLSSPIIIMPDRLNPIGRTPDC